MELTRAVSGTRVWGQSYERPATDLMGVEAEIAQAIAEGVGGRLAPAERRSLAVQPSRNPEAYDHYLRGNYFLARRTPTDTRFAIDQYQKAIGLDSSFTAALARIGYSYGLFLDWGWTYPELSWDSVLGRGIAIADRALALDSNAADVWMTRGYLLGLSHPETFAGVDAAFERAITLDPRNSEAYHQDGFLLVIAGRYAAADTMARRALAIEAERPVTLLTLGYLHHLQRRDAEVQALCDTAIALVPDAAWVYARCSLWRPRSDLAGALRDAQTAARLEPADYPIEAEAALAAAEFRRGDTIAARRRIARVVASFSASGFEAAQFVAIALAVTGDVDGAIAILKQMRPQGAFQWRITQDPWFDGIRNDPRFRALVDESRPPNPKD